jgi:hypothetical protein
MMGRLGVRLVHVSCSEDFVPSHVTMNLDETIRKRERMPYEVQKLHQLKFNEKQALSRPNTSPKLYSIDARPFTSFHTRTRIYSVYIYNYIMHMV